MKSLSMDKAIKRRRLLRFNILVGFIVFVAGIYMMITGEYASLQERNAAERIYNAMIIGSVLYMAVIWISCMMSKPFWFPRKKEQ